MLFAITQLISGLIGIAILVLFVGAVTGNLFFVVKQQHAVIIERLGKFKRIVGAGFHAKIPFIDRKAATVSLRTMKNGFDIDVKTQDNVTIGLEVSAQYHVSYEMGTRPSESGVYKSYYMLQQPVAQMRDFITDALRSSIPVYTLDEVFAKKDDIAKDVNATVSEQMDAYGFTLVSTLITKIALPSEVEDSMNQINAAQRTKAAAQDLAEADRIRRVTEAKAEAEAMEKAGEGIANQRKAIALGIKDSLEIIQETGVGNDEANQLFMFTQWTEMMNEFAKSGRASTVVLPADFTQSASIFEQMVTASQANDSAPVPPVPAPPAPQKK
ncbi:SPFH domain-containing protein [Collinsella provencensis]|uniref:SPFH domain-containing protein n=1 Tax=Collinsella provencensis TaxID=1937461 RepID=UPI0018FE388F|nr:SPFH domain-containing protein [Collinsella provencensis]